MKFTEKEEEYIVSRVEKAFLGSDPGFERDATEGGVRSLLYFSEKDRVDFFTLKDVVKELKRNNEYRNEQQ